MGAHPDEHISDIANSNDLWEGQKPNKLSIDFSQTGQDLVEFAIVIPLLLLILVGVLDLGRLFHTGITITNSARAGARFAALDRNASNGLIEQATIQEANNSGIEVIASQIAIYCPHPNLKLGPCPGGTPLRVTITYDFDLMLNGLFSIPSIQLVRSYEMMVQ